MGSRGLLVVEYGKRARHRSRRGIAFRLGESWTFAADRGEGSPLAFRLAQWQESIQADAEDQRAPVAPPPLAA